MPARGGLLHTPAAPAVNVTQRSFVGHSVGEGQALAEAKEQSTTEAIWCVLRLKSQAQSETAADGQVARGRAMRATVIQSNALFGDRPKQSQGGH